MRIPTLLASALLATYSKIVVANPTMARSSIVLRDDFEAPAPNFNFGGHNIEGNGSIESVTSPVFQSTHAGRFLVPNDGSSFRSEVKSTDFGYGHFRYTFANYLPRNWTQTDLGTVVAQWKTFRPKGVDKWHPPVALTIKRNRWFLDIHYVQHTGDKVTKGRTLDLGTVNFGQWNQWDIEIQWSQPNQDGTITVKINCETYKDAGLNNYSLSKAPYFKMGIYRPHWKPRFAPYPTGGAPVILYVDDVTVTKLG